MKVKRSELSGILIYKSCAEYFPENSRSLFGDPHYLITSTDHRYSLWELDPEDPDSGEYTLLREGTAFSELHELAMSKDEKLWEFKDSFFYR